MSKSQLKRYRYLPDLVVQAKDIVEAKKHITKRLESLLLHPSGIKNSEIKEERQFWCES